MDQVAQVREKVDIISFISEYISLKKAGKNFQALCPFHGEKTPSFVVSPERQIWHCFGCGAGGDVFTFLMQYEHLEFPEALRYLAKQAGVELRQASYADTVTSAKKDRLYKVNHLAAEYFHYVLTKHAAGKNALRYLQNRGINEKLIEAFRLGFAPAAGKALVRYLLQKKHFQKDEVIDTGLAVSYGSGLSDFFRGRLMFPLIDHRDNVLGFSGRLLDDKTGAGMHQMVRSFGGKYINTRDTLIYHKREHFFGLHITKESIRKANQAILVEGEFDALSCLQHGIGNVVAVKGTALTEQQVNLLSRFAQKVSICFDGDPAGQEAIKRSLPILAKKRLNTTVIVIPAGKDPDEALKTQPGEFKRAVANDINIYDYLFDQTILKYPPTSPEGKRSIADELLPIIGDIDNAIVKEHYLRKLSVEIKTTYESITRELEKLKKKVKIEETMKAPRMHKPREEILEEYLLALILQSENQTNSLSLMKEKLSGYIEKESSSQKLLQFLLTIHRQAPEARFDVAGSNLPVELTDAYNTAQLFPVPAFSDEGRRMEEIEKVSDQLRSMYIKSKIKLLAGQINQKETEGKEEEIESIKEEYSRMIKMLKK